MGEERDLQTQQKRKKKTHLLLIILPWTLGSDPLANSIRFLPEQVYKAGAECCLHSRDGTTGRESSEGPSDQSVPQ